MKKKQQQKSEWWEDGLNDLLDKLVHEVGSDGSDESIWNYNRIFKLVRQELRKAFKDGRYVAKLEGFIAAGWSGSTKREIEELKSKYLTNDEGQTTT